MKFPILREAGRVLSKANQDKLAQASDHMATAHGHVKDVIASVGGGESDAAKADDATEETAVSEAYKPQPYKADADETVTCPNCGKMDDVDAKYCDQCGFELTGAEGVKVDGKVVEAQRSFGQLRQTVNDAVRAQFCPQNDYDYCCVYVNDLYDSYAIVENNGELLSIPWALGADGMVTFGEATPVMVTYAPVSAATGDNDADGDDGVLAPAGVPTAESRRLGANAPLTGDIIPLIESAIRDDGAAKIKLIKPGWGSTGYYPPDVLKRDGPKAFPKGTHMYLDHPTATEEAERPERSLKDLAATLTEDAQWIDRGPDGPGLYAAAQVRDDFKRLLNEIAPYTGVSIHAYGKASPGTFDGKHGDIIEKIHEATVTQNSVDFVTRPGAGGHMLELFEAARAPQKGPAAMTAANTPLIEAQALRIARLEEALVLRDAEAFVAAGLRSVDLPDMTRARIAEALGKNPPAKDGTLDRDALATRLDEAVKSETAYLVEVAGYGRVSGMGYSQPVETDDPAKLHESLTSSFEGLGLSKEAAALAARGRS
jgi:hypothetical protein